jgi:hypothetical protein
MSIFYGFRYILFPTLFAGNIDGVSRSLNDPIVPEDHQVNVLSTHMECSLAFYPTPSFSQSEGSIRASVLMVGLIWWTYVHIYYLTIFGLSMRRHSFACPELFLVLIAVQFKRISDSCPFRCSLIWRRVRHHGECTLLPFPASFVTLVTNLFLPFYFFSCIIGFSFLLSAVCSFVSFPTVVCL